MPRTAQSVSAVILNGYRWENPPTMTRSPETDRFLDSGRQAPLALGLPNQPKSICWRRLGCNLAQLHSSRHGHEIGIRLPCNQAGNAMHLVGESGPLRG
jgi:hypothetical protein